MFAEALKRLDNVGPLYKQIIFVAIVSFLVAMLFIFLATAIALIVAPDFVSQAANNSNFDDEAWVVAIFVAPPVETLLFQTWLLVAIKKLTELTGDNASWFPAFLVTSVVFAAAHGLQENSIYLGIFGTLTRVPLSFALALLAISQRSNELGRPFVAVTFAHGLYNLLIFVLIAAINFQSLL